MTYLTKNLTFFSSLDGMLALCAEKCLREEGGETPFSRKKEIAERPQTFRYLKIKNLFPLIMAKAHAAAI